mmetsp:Transcript_6160/g.7600  ORF Transcript_6160/g.7600 Transcript_6160/m.7600 type:complete len:385 (-) Transcript_6160:170-1324(-)
MIYKHNPILQLVQVDLVQLLVHQPLVQLLQHQLLDLHKTQEVLLVLRNQHQHLALLQVQEHLPLALLQVRVYSVLHLHHKPHQPLVVLPVLDLAELVALLDPLLHREAGDFLEAHLQQLLLLVPVLQVQRLHSVLLQPQIHLEVHKLVHHLVVQLQVQQVQGVDCSDKVQAQRLEHPQLPQEVCLVTLQQLQLLVLPLVLLQVALHLVDLVQLLVVVPHSVPQLRQHLGQPQAQQEVPCLVQVLVKQKQPVRLLLVLQHLLQQHLRSTLIPHLHQQEVDFLVVLHRIRLSYQPQEFNQMQCQHQGPLILQPFQHAALIHPLVMFQNERALVTKRLKRLQLLNAGSLWEHLTIECQRVLYQSSLLITDEAVTHCLITLHLKRSSA